MSVLNLDRLFRPASVAVIGASEHAGTVGDVVMRNLQGAGFAGAILPVHPDYARIHGHPAAHSIAELPIAPDLAVICTPAETVPRLIGELGVHGVRAAAVLSAGLRRSVDGERLDEQMLRAAKAYGLRILGPNCIGILVPRIGLNASFAHVGAQPGNIAVVSQSGALCTVMLDWARSRNIGFSCFVSLGDSADIDVGDVLDFLASDPATRGILLYLESLRDARKFMSAARAAGRNKIVLAIKAGRHEAGARAVQSHTGALAGRDEVFDAALRRAGLLRVHTIDELFDAAETLAHARPLRGKRLLILTNGGGPGVLAADQLGDRGGELANLSQQTVERLAQTLPATWSGGNPVDIIGDADAARYRGALRILLEDTGFDALLILLVPTALVDNGQVANAVIESVRDISRPVLTCWMGEDGVAGARQVLSAAGIATYDTPASAIRAFMQMVEYGENQASLMQTPASVPEDFVPQDKSVHDRLQKILSEGRTLLTEPEAKDVLADYGIPVVPTREAAGEQEAVRCAESLGFPVALKIRSPDISHKSDHGGVVLDIESAQELRNAVAHMRARIRDAIPDARLDGFSVQPMVRRAGALELILGAAQDPIFGPVLMFGQGGVSAEIAGDTALALPPLNLALAGQLVQRTRISRLLAGYRNVAPADLRTVHLALVKLSQLIVDHAEIVEIDINPLLADRDGVLALDARIRVSAAVGTGADRLAIRPYPKELEEQVEFRGHRLVLRPIRPEDEPAHREFFQGLSPSDMYFRFFRAVHDFSHEQLARFTQIDYHREMALIATEAGPGGSAKTLGVVRAVANPDLTEAEFAVIVRSDWHRMGLGRLLMDRMIRYARQRGIRRLVGQTLVDNVPMQNLARSLGFKSRLLPAERVVELELEIAGA